jgi:hypothetical protein
MTAARHSPITLSAALLLGAALGLAGMRADRPSPAAATVPSADTAIAATDSAPSTFAAGRDTAAAASSAAVYSAAWELLKDGKLPREERRVIQRALLEEWCRIDLRAALHAAFEEDETTREAPFTTPLFGSCSEGIRSQPDLAWNLISSREFGLHTRTLRREWIHLTAEDDPPTLVRRFSELPPDVLLDAIWAAAASTYRSTEPIRGREELNAAMFAMSKTPTADAATGAFAAGIAARLQHKQLLPWVRKPPEAWLRKPYLDAYVLSLRRLAADELTTVLENLPNDLRAEVEKAPCFPSREPGE